MKKLEPWTKVKVLWCSNNHKYKKGMNNLTNKLGEETNLILM